MVRYHSHSYVDMILADKPFAYWRLNELDGTVAYDISGNANHGVYNGNVTRGIDSAVENGDFAIKVTNNQSVSFVKDLTGLIGPFSYEFWINPTIIPTIIPYAVVFSFASAENNFSIHTANARTSIMGVAEEVYTFIYTGQWAHIVGMWDDAGYVKLYKDGVLFINSTWAGSLNLGNGTHYIGRYSSSLDYPWEGGIDEVALYNYALTASQVQSHYLKGNLTSLFKRARKAV